MARKAKLPSGMCRRGETYYARFSSNGRTVRKRLSRDLRTAKLLLNDLMARSDRADFGYLDNDCPWKELRVAFEVLVEEADLKFRDYDPYRLLLIAISQSGLDLEFHAGRFKDGKSILLTWMDALCERINNIDAIFLEPGVNVWLAGGKVMAGHKYMESKAGHCPELWRRSGVPGLLV